MTPAAIAAARALLAVEPGVDRRVLRRAYRAAAKRLHPDTLGREATPGDLAAMAALNAAYALLVSLPSEPRRVAPLPAVRPPDAVIDVSHLFATRPKPQGVRRGDWPEPPPLPPRPARTPRPRRPVAHLGKADPVAVRYTAPLDVGPAPDPAVTIIPFGRYEGSSVAAVGERDPGYLRWLLRAVSAHPPVRAAARAYLTAADEMPTTTLTDRRPEPTSGE
jgi:hypothetical protein